MGISQSPKIVNDGLVFHFDAKNNKSYTGPVIANEFAVPTPAANGAVTFAIQGTGTFYRVPAGEVHGGYKVGADDVVYRYDLGATGCHYHGNQTTITAGQYATWQFDYYISKGIADFPTVNYLANMENVGAGIGGAVTVNAPTIGAAGNWRSIRYTIGPATTTGLLRPLLYPGACSTSYLASSGYILYRNPTVWYTSFIPSANLPYVSGSRSNTQAILDLTKQNTITATSLTYANDGTFSFNGTSDVIECGNDAAINFGTGNFTVSAWFKRDTNATTNLRLLSKGGDSDTADRAGFAFYGGDTSAGFIVNPSGVRTIITAATYAVGEWVNVVGLVERGVTMRSYKNGNLVGSAAAPVGSVSGSLSLFIGNNAGSGLYWPGEISQVSLYNRALTAAEIVQNFNAHRGRYGI